MSAAASAVPMLRSASECLNCSGWLAPVRMIVLVVKCSLRYSAVSMRASVPWVMMIVSAGAFSQAVLSFSWCCRVMSRLSILKSSVSVWVNDLCGMRSRMRSIAGGPTVKSYVPLFVSYCLSIVPPVVMK